MKAQDISSVECLFDIDNIFAFLELDSDELIPLKRKAGFLLNDGRFVVKKGIIHKVDIFLVLFVLLINNIQHLLLTTIQIILLI